MDIKTLEVTKENLMEILTDPNVYVIKECGLSGERYRMLEIKETDVGDVLNPRNSIIRITGDDV